MSNNYKKKYQIRKITKKHQIKNLSTKDKQSKKKKNGFLAWN